jgi:hypothetical protein
MADDSPRADNGGLSWEMIALIFGGVGIAAYTFKKIATDAGEKEAKKQVTEGVDKVKEAVGLG